MLVQAGQSAAGIGLAARYAELVFSGPPSLEAAVAFRAGLHAQVTAAGRDPAHVLVLPALMVTLGGTEPKPGPGPSGWKSWRARSSAGRTRCIRPGWTQMLSTRTFRCPLSSGPGHRCRQAARNTCMRPPVRGRALRCARSPGK